MPIFRLLKVKQLLFLLVVGYPALILTVYTLRYYFQSSSWFFHFPFLLLGMLVLLVHVTDSLVDNLSWHEVKYLYSEGV